MTDPRIAALAEALSELVQAVGAQHPKAPRRGLDGEHLGVWCDGCDAAEADCWGDRAISAALAQLALEATDAPLDAPLWVEQGLSAGDADDA